MSADDEPRGYGDIQRAKDEIVDKVFQDQTEKKSSNVVLRLLQFLASFLVPGMGMLCEAYVIFAPGNLTNIFKTEYPNCWKTNQECPSSLTGSVTYSQIAGIIAGQLLLGFIFDRLGRKWGSVTNTSIMLVGAILLTAANGPTTKGLFLMYVIAQGIYGFGVGGEYVSASSIANERAGMVTHLRRLRGRTVMLIFSNQGLGSVLNTAVILALLAIYGQSGPTYNPSSLEHVWRISYGLVIVPLSFMLVWRTFFVKESSQWTSSRKALTETGQSVSFSTFKLLQLLRYFGTRIFASGATWFVNDFAFYGNKLFQGVFIKIIVPNASIKQVLEYSLLNAAVGYSGYILAAFMVDLKFMGRVRLQALGFFMSFMLFLICGVAYDQLVKPEYIHYFQAIYYLSSFFQQFGPNTVTYLISGELVPTELRSTAFGWAAATGKVGALIAGATLDLPANKYKYIISAIMGLIGVFVTILLVPDTSSLDLVELDRYWLYILDGKAKFYHGEAVNPKHLSLMERAIGIAKPYSPVLDKTFADPHKEDAKAADDV